MNACVQRQVNARVATRGGCCSGLGAGGGGDLLGLRVVVRSERTTSVMPVFGAEKSSFSDLQSDRTKSPFAAFT